MLNAIGQFREAYYALCIMNYALKKLCIKEVMNCALN